MKFLPYLISPAPWLIARTGPGIPSRALRLSQ